MDGNETPAFARQDPAEGRGLSEPRVTINMTPREALEFAQRIAYDDSFRAKFESSPREILSFYHIDMSAALIPAKIVLPPKEDIQRALTEILIGGELAGRAISFFIVFWAFFAFSPGDGVRQQ